MLAFVTKYLYNKRKVFGVLFVVFCILIGTVPFIVSWIGTNITSLDELDFGENSEFSVGGSRLYYNNMSYGIFSHNNPFHLLFNNDTTLGEISKDTLNVIDVNNTNYNKVLCKFSGDNSFGEEKSFYFVRNNELYYSVFNYDDDKVFNKKINLSNCKITDLIDKYEIFDIEMNYENYIYMYYYDYYFDDTSFIKYDYINNKILKSQRTVAELDEMDSSILLIDYEKFDIYYIDEDTIYKNKDIIYESKDNELYFLSMSGNYIFFYDEKLIYQFDLTTNTIVNKMENKFEEIGRIADYMNNNYFVADDMAYKYNEDTKDFEFVMKLSDGEYTMYNYGDKRLISNDTYMTAFFFDIKTKNVTEYEASFYEYNDGILYLLDFDDNDKLVIKQIK